MARDDDPRITDERTATGTYVLNPYRTRLAETRVADYFIEQNSTPQGEWPHARFSTRNKVFEELEQVWAGNLTSLQDGRDTKRDLTLQIEFAQRIIQVVVDILLVSEPECSVDLKEPLSETISQLLLSEFIYGGAHAFGRETDEGISFIIPEPYEWYPYPQDGGAIVQPFVTGDSKDQAPNKVRVWRIYENSVDEIVREWSGSWIRGQIGPRDSTARITGKGGVVTIPRLPARKGWGPSLVDKLAVPTFETARRNTQASDILTRNAFPPVVFRSSRAALEKKYPVPTDASLNPDNLTQAQWIRKQLALQVGDELIELDDKMQDVGYLEWSGQLESAFQQLTNMREYVNFLSGLPAMLDFSAQAPQSGSALRLQYFPFYSNTSSLQNLVVQRMETLFSELGVSATFTWPHIFDKLGEEEQSGMGEVEEKPDGGRAEPS